MDMSHISWPSLRYSSVFQPVDWIARRWFLKLDSSILRIHSHDLTSLIVSSLY